MGNQRPEKREKTAESKSEEAKTKTEKSGVTEMMEQPPYKEKWKPIVDKVTNKRNRTV